MAAATNNLESVDFGGQVLMVKSVKTGFNSPGNNPNTLGTSDTNNSVNSGASLTMTRDLHLGVPVNLNNATGAITLPAATGTGNQYSILVTLASTAATITAAGSDKIAGVATMGTAAGTAPNAFSIASGTTITMNGTTKGGVVGSAIYLTDAASALWVVEANMIGSGTPVTPFS